MRTCVGCRQRSTKSELVRVVADAEGPAPSAVPDVTGRRAGRGAHLHPVLTCLELAERRRAFGRALRIEGPVDVTAVRRWVEAHDQPSLEVLDPPATAT